MDRPPRCDGNRTDRGRSGFPAGLRPIRPDPTRVTRESPTDDPIHPVADATSAGLAPARTVAKPAGGPPKTGRRRVGRLRKTESGPISASRSDPDIFPLLRRGFPLSFIRSAYKLTQYA